MSILLVAVLILVYTAHSLFASLFSKHYPGEHGEASRVYSVYYGLIVSLATLAASGFVPKISWLTLLLGIANGVAVMLYNLSLIGAAERGPYSVVMVFSLFGGILVPLAVSVVAYREHLTPVQWAAILIMLVAFVFLNIGKKGEKLKDSVKKGFFALCLLQFCANGAYGTLLSVQERLTEGTENNGMTVVTYAVVFLLSALLLALRRRERMMTDLRLNRKSVACLIICTGAVTAGIMILMHCLSLMNVAVLYTVENGGVLLLSVILSAFLFREKMTVSKGFGIVLSVVSMVLLGLQG